MVVFSEMFISDLLNIPVVDHVQDPIGRVSDILVTMGETFPKVVGLIVNIKEEKKQNILSMSEIDLVGKQFVACKAVSSRICFTTLRDGEVLLARDVLDKQIVDTEGARVIRVNDLKLAKVDQEIRLIAVDIGFSGLLRRLGVLRLFGSIAKIFRKRIPDKLIGWDHVEQFKTDIVAGRIAIPHKRVEELHPADIAYIISQVHEEEKTAIFFSLSERKAAESLHELEPRLQAVLLQRLEKKKALSVLERMPADEIADVLGDMPQENTEQFLRLLKVRKSNQVRKLLTHSDETAGGLMTTEYITLPENISVDQGIKRLRELAVGAETIYYIYIINLVEKLVGVMSLRDLIVAAPESRIKDIMTKELIKVDPTDEHVKVADIISKYNLVAVPVVDKDKKILGIVTVDDVMDVVLPPISRRYRHMMG